MTAGHSEDTTPYHDAVAAIHAEQALHAARFADGRWAYDKFYDLAAQIGAEKAKDVLPEEARIVTALEASAPDRGRQLNMAREALLLSLETEMRSIAESSVMAEGSIIGRLRADLKQLGRYREQRLDGINGQFWDVVRQGYGDFKQERGRMINRVLSAWSDVYDVALGTMIKAATIIDTMPDHYMTGTQWDMTSEAVTERWNSYPFDLVSDLGEIRNWDERDPEAADALLLHLQHGNDLSR